MINEDAKGLLFENLLDDDNKQEFRKFIQETELSDKDYKSIILSLLEKDYLFENIPICNYEIVMDNIQDDDWLNDESNYY